jgi:serine/threonine-protein kinase
VPWEGDNPLAVMSQHLNAPFPPIHELVPDVPAPVEGIIRKCLRKDPENRYQDAAALLSDLEGWHDLDLSSFVFADEAPAKAETQRGLWLLVAGISIGFVVACTLLVFLYYVLVHWAK